MNSTEIAEKLGTACYGAPASVDLGDGRTVSLAIEIDYDTHISDYDTFGTFSKYAYDYVRDEGRTRPDGMDGNAQKVQVDRGSFVWWQPPTDGPQRGTPEFDSLRNVVRDILESGYVGYVVELRDGTDAVGRPHAVDVASLWGIENVYESGPQSEYGQSIIRDLLAEIEITE